MSEVKSISEIKGGNSADIVDPNLSNRVDTTGDPNATSSIVDPNLTNKVNTTNNTVSDTDNRKEVKPGDIREYKPEVQPVSIVDEVLGKLDQKIEETKNTALEHQAEANIISEMGAGNGDTVASSLRVATTPVPTDEVTPVSEDVVPSTDDNVDNHKLDVDLDDFPELNEDDENDPQQDLSDQQMNVLKSAIKEKIKPITESLDISTFTISKQAVALSTALQAPANKRVTDWALFNCQEPIHFEEFTGTEIESLNTETSGRSRYNALHDQWQRIYDHINGPKPATLEEFMRLLSIGDVDHVFFGIYKNAFDGSNYIPYNCTNEKCNNIFLSDNIDIMNMVEFKDETAKTLFDNIMKKAASAKNLYVAEAVPVSNRYAIAFREPSAWNVIMENSLLDPDFVSKYETLLSIIVYVDSIYYIDMENKTLRPIEFKNYANNMVKTIKARIVLISKILQTLSSDQYNTLISYIKNINDMIDHVTYILPEVTCPKCGTVIPKSAKKAQELLFTRHQLAAIANI